MTARELRHGALSLLFPIRGAPESAFTGVPGKIGEAAVLPDGLPAHDLRQGNRYSSQTSVRIANIPLVPDSGDAHYVLYRDISIERNIADAAEENYQLAHLALDATP